VNVRARLNRERIPGLGQPATGRIGAARGVFKWRGPHRELGIPWPFPPFSERPGLASHSRRSGS
jgi:hypothetical protein